ncbi:MAG: nickel-dependent lactate racemase [Actinomycetota bacterium]|nr:nickel-dependent lactate racemase [Actinomycetota bacterium]
MGIKLDYGNTKLEVEVPERNLLYVLETRPTKPVDHPEQKIAESIKNPIDSQPLEKLVAGKKDVCIIISDSTRAVPTRLILEVLLAELESYGIARENITILIATGLHRPNVGKELEQLVGKNIAETYRIINHDARDRQSCQDIGQTSQGTPVILNKNYLKADFKILTGLIEPHFMAGFSGGRKSICPGISYMDMFKYFHGPAILESSHSTTGVLDGNPFHEEATEIAKKAGVDFIVNVTINKEKQVTGIFCGDLVTAHRQGAEFCLKSSRAEISQEADIVITTGGGLPLDVNVYQAVKGMVGCLPAVKQDGMIIIAAQCIQEIGSQEFTQLLKSEKDLGRFMDRICNTDYFKIDQWELEELAKARKKAEIYLYSHCLTDCGQGIPEDTLKLVNSVSEALDIGFARYGKDAKVTVIPEGPYVMPFLKK